MALPGIGEDGGVTGPFLRVQVVGLSMEPALRNGEWWLVRRTSRLHPGDVVVLTHPQRPHMLEVKRLDRREGDSWWVLGDNPDWSTDSRHFGAIPASLILGRAILRYHPLRRR